MLLVAIGGCLILLMSAQAARDVAIALGDDGVPPPPKRD